MSRESSFLQCNFNVKSLGIALIAIMLMAGFAAGSIELGAPFASNAVLQRDMKVPVWGWSKAGCVITVEFAGQSKSAAAGEDGKWMVKLDPLTASFEPGEMVITDCAGQKVTLSNILVGEVWMASGQSNMQWVAGKSSSGKLKTAPVNGVAPIRECAITNFNACLHPLEHATGVWNNGGYNNYSAIAYAFAHKLYEELKVPIGILNCSFSETSIQAWTPRVGYEGAKDEYSQNLLKKVRMTDPRTTEHKEAWAKFYKDIEDTLKENDELVKQGLPAKKINNNPPGNNKNRDESWLFNARLNPMVPYAIKGAIWNQGYANQNEGLYYYNNLHSMIRGWRKVWNKPNLPVYFHQFYCPAPRGGWKDSYPAIGGAADMRMGTSLARDIKNANMASQIDIEGTIHYRNKAVPGQRLALHALKNQYGKKIVADGPMFKKYKVKGNKLIVNFAHAKGGLVVAKNSSGRETGGFAIPQVIENGDEQVKLFYIADENRVWYQADMKIKGNKAILTSPKVKKPCGVSYGSGGVGFRASLYNKALLPATPFIYFKNELVTAQSWKDGPLKIDGKVVDPSAGGLLYEYRKMPILSTQFRDNAVFQAGVPVTIWGSTKLFGEWTSAPSEENTVIHFSFGDIKKTIKVTPDMDEWQVVLPPMEAGNKPYTLKVSCTIDGELAHERTLEGIVFGDVWYVAAPPAPRGIKASGKNESGDNVRVIARKAKRSATAGPWRFSVAVSRSPKNRFSSQWQTAGGGIAGALGQRIHAKTKTPVGIIYMEAASGRGSVAPELSSWMSFDALKGVRSLKGDYENLGAAKPGNRFYKANVNRYVDAWKKHWSEYVPAIIENKKAPANHPWGMFPRFTSSITSKATQTNNVLVCSFTPASVKGIIFLSCPSMFKKDKGAKYGEQLSALANSWKKEFGGPDQHFVYTIPSKRLAGKISAPKNIKGKSSAIEIGKWGDRGAIDKLIETAVNENY